MDASSDSALAFSSASRTSSPLSSPVSPPRRDIMMNAPMIEAPTIAATMTIPASMVLPSSCHKGDKPLKNDRLSFTMLLAKRVWIPAFAGMTDCSSE